MRKPISWLQLWTRIGRQNIGKTRDSKVQILIDGQLKDCTLVFTDMGQNFHLEIVGTENKE